jgi:hypothetical protein
MALQEKHRNTIYTEFTKTLGEEATQALLSQFPARDVDEPATKADLDLLGAQLRLEIVDKITNRMLTIGGLGLAAMTGLLALFT